MRSLLLISLLAWPALADPPPEPIRLPKQTVPKADPPPGVPLVLTKDLTFVIDGDKPFIVKTIPPGMVKVVPEESPFTIKTWFADNPTVIERKTFKGKYIVSLDPVKDGSYELLVILEEKFQKSADGKPTITAPIAEFNRSVEGGLYVTVPIDDTGVWKRPMQNGTDPRPPPGPGPDPAPGPVTSFRVIFAYPSIGLTPAQSNVMYAASVEKWMTENTTTEGGFVGWRRVDANSDLSNDAPTMAALWTAAKAKITTTPCLIVEVNKDVKILPYPASPEAALTTLKQYKGVK